MEFQKTSQAGLNIHSIGVEKAKWLFGAHLISFFFRKSAHGRHPHHPNAGKPACSIQFFDGGHHGEHLIYDQHYQQNY